MPADPRSRYSTGNEFVTLDEITTATGALKSLCFLYESARGTVLMGSTEADLLQPRITLDGEPLDFGAAEWRLTRHWIPEACIPSPGGEAGCAYLAPPAQRGFCLRLSLAASRSARVRLGFDISWDLTCHVSDTVRNMQGVRAVGARSGCLYFAFHSAWPLFGLGMVTSEESEWDVKVGDLDVQALEAPPDLLAREVAAHPREQIKVSIQREVDAAAGDIVTLTLHAGLGIESRGGAGTAHDLNAEGWDSLLEGTLGWLESRAIGYRGDDVRVEQRLNEHALYCYHFSQGVTLDSERMVVTSSRSPRYDYTGTYRDRDGCLYSFPAVLLIDPGQARRMLEYTFSAQMRNVGSRSRYLDGVLMQPGFELDALMSPLRALWMYVDLTKDLTILFDQNVQAGVNHILIALEERAAGHTPLYSTRLSPGERPHPLSYLTYDNVLVWRGLVDLSDLYNRIRDVERSQETERWAADVHAAVLRHCVVDGPYGRMFCYATDLEGQADLGSDPEGSLLLLAHLEFCAPDFLPFANTARWLRERNTSLGLDETCILVWANDLLAGQTDVLERVLSASLDEGVGCAMVDSDGTAQKGRGWAALSGYLSYTLIRALEHEVDPPVLQPEERQPSRISRTTLRPGVGWI